MVYLLFFWLLVRMFLVATKQQKKDRGQRWQLYKWFVEKRICIIVYNQTNMGVCH